MEPNFSFCGGGSRTEFPCSEDERKDDLKNYYDLFPNIPNTTSFNTPLLHMDFLQVLIHQHAKTIVALQDLKTEVKTLNTFRQNILTSLPELTTSELKTNPWKTTDSGFSTSKSKSTSSASSAIDSSEEDPLYSLLDIIQTKVKLNSCSCTSTREKLGKLDDVLGFKCDCVQEICPGCLEGVDRRKLRIVLGERDYVELQRQVIFAVGRVKLLEQKLKQKESEEEPQKYLHLSQENDQLRFKLKEQEIELEGTKAKLRILEKNWRRDKSNEAAAAASTSTTMTLTSDIRNSDTNTIQLLDNTHMNTPTRLSDTNITKTTINTNPTEVRNSTPTKNTELDKTSNSSMSNSTKSLTKSKIPIRSSKNSLESQKSFSSIKSNIPVPVSSNSNSRNKFWNLFSSQDKV